MDANDFDQVNESLDSLVAMVAGYKAKLIDAGFCPENAEYMAVEFHSLYIESQVEVNRNIENDDD